MGINGLCEFLKNKYPQILKREHISYFAFKRISLDVSPFIYRFINVYGKEDNQWIRCFINLIILLKKNYIRFIPIFDGDIPIEKTLEQIERKNQKNKKQEDIKQIEYDLEEYKIKGIISDKLQKINQTYTETYTKASLLHSFTEDNNINKSININKIEEYIEKQRKHIFNINKYDIEKIIEVFRAFGIPYLIAPYESEQLCCSLVNNGICDAVLSPDSDCIAYNSKVIINNLDTTDGSIRYIEIEYLKEELKLNSTQVLDFCILLGCDYNRTFKIKNVGPVKAYQLIKKYEDINKITEYDISKIKIEECKKIFNYELDEKIIIQLKNIEKEVKFDIEEIKNICSKYNIFINYKFIHEIKNPKIIIEKE